MHLFVSTSRFATLMALGALCLAPLLAAAADDDHVVTNVVNGVVYVSLGTRDGALAGRRIEVLDQSKNVVARLDLELCGEVICRAKLPPELAGKILRGMEVRFPPSPVAGSASPPATSAPTPVTPAPPSSSEHEPSGSAPEPPAPAPSTSSSGEEWSEPPAADIPKKKPKRPQHVVVTGLTLESVLSPYANPTNADATGGVAPIEKRYSGGPVPAGYRVVDKSSPGVVKTGWWLFGISYGLSAIGGLGGDKASLLLLPGLGPWLYLASKPKSLSSDDTDALLVLLGLGQDVGLLVLGIGYAPSKTLVKQDTGVSLRVSPILGRDTYGLGITGTL